MSNRMYRASLIAVLSGGIALLMPGNGQAGVVYTLTNGSYSNVGGDSATGLYASADFSVVNNSQLQIVLTNTATSAQGAGAILTNLEFDLSGIGLGIGTGSSVNVSGGSTIVGAPVGFTGTDVSGGFAFGTGVTPAGLTNTQQQQLGTPFDYGVTATSFVSATGSEIRFDGTSTSGSNGVFGPMDGVDWGLVPLNNSGNTGSNDPWIANSVTILLNINSGSLTSDTDIRNKLSNVFFTYGSSQAGIAGALQGTSQPPVTVPEPATITMLLATLVPLGVVGLRRVRRRSGPVSA